MSPSVKTSTGSDLVLSDSGHLRDGEGPCAVVFNDGTTYIVSGHFRKDSIVTMATELLQKRREVASVVVYRMERALKLVPSSSSRGREKTLLDVAPGTKMHLVRGLEGMEVVSLARPFIMKAGAAYGSVRVVRENSDSITLNLTATGVISQEDRHLGTMLSLPAD